MVYINLQFTKIRTNLGNKISTKNSQYCWLKEDLLRTVKKGRQQAKKGQPNQREDLHYEFEYCLLGDLKRLKFLYYAQGGLYGLKMQKCGEKIGKALRGVKQKKGKNT